MNNDQIRSVPGYTRFVKEGEAFLLVSIAAQTLELLRDGNIILSYPVSTAKNGPGEKLNSFCTPRGWHCIRQKIGNTAPAGAVFRGRKFTGDIASEGSFPEKDLILTRILWLDGLEQGFNKGGIHDSYSRFIYIHGTNHEKDIGSPVSAGCIRMRNSDIIELFDRVKPGTIISIQEKA